MTAETTGAVRKSLSTAAFEHVGLLVSALIAFLVVLRLLMMARWDTGTASAILQHAGSASVVLGIAVSIAPSIITTGLWIAGSLHFYEWSRDGKWPGIRLSAWLLVMSILIGLTIASTFQLLFMLIVWLVAFVAGHSDRVGDPDVTRRENVRLILSQFVAIAVSGVVLSDTPWLPAERVTVEDADPFTAYVLSGDDDATWVVLRDSTRRVEFIGGTSGRTRELCDKPGGWPGEWFWDRAIDLVGTRDQPQYPDCP